MDKLSPAELEIAQHVIERIAELAEAFGAQAGVGGMEIAGNLISYLAGHPNDIAPLLRFGIFELPDRWFELGSLTWHAWERDGRVVAPDFARRARTIKKLRGLAAPP